MRALIFDTETTDLISNSLLPPEHQPRVIEFFGHIVDDETGAVIEELEFLCHPGMTISPKITQITTITNEQLADQKPFAHYLPQVKALVAKAEAAVAHNLSYDLAVMQFEATRNKTYLEFPKVLNCTVEKSEWYKGHRLNLSSLHQYLFSREFTGAHRARADVEALTRCYLEMRKRGDI